ncbi:MAG: acetylglutamate kinase [Desulfobacteraceae bacterium]|nr:MAG: acetylglutamate kinase [Desulfobacteraceae bacterium]
MNSQEKTKALIEAFHYVKSFKDRIMVIKYGGNAMVNEKIKESVFADISLLRQLGQKIVFVHGGGPFIDRQLQEAGIQKVVRNGLRVTDAKTLEIVAKIFKEINRDCVEQFQRHRIAAQDCTAGLLVTQISDDCLGYVGDIVEVKRHLLLDMLDRGIVPVVSSIGTTFSGQKTNINADTAAVEIAVSLQAAKLTILTNVDGVFLGDTLVSHMNIQDIKIGIAKGTITDGMIPKLMACSRAVEQEVAKAHLINGTFEHALLLELFTENGIGTEVVKS